MVTVGLSRGNLKTQLGVEVQPGEEMHEAGLALGTRWSVPFTENMLLFTLINSLDIE